MLVYVYVSGNQSEYVNYILVLWLGFVKLKLHWNLTAAMNPKEKQCDNAAVQADYMAVAECKKLHCSNEPFSFVISLLVCTV